MLLAGGNVKPHGASPWPANRGISLLCSCEHETTQGQPVVSAKASVHHLCLPTFSWRTGARLVCNAVRSEYPYQQITQITMIQ